LFLLPGGRPRHFAPELADPAAAEELRDPWLGKISGEEVVLEEVSEVLRASRKLHLKSAAGVEVSSPSARIRVSGQRPAVK
jgi:hypothetical protein